MNKSRPSFLNSDFAALRLLSYLRCVELRHVLREAVFCFYFSFFLREISGCIPPMFDHSEVNSEVLGFNSGRYARNSHVSLVQRGG